MKIEERTEIVRYYVDGDFSMEAREMWECMDMLLDGEVTISCDEERKYFVDNEIAQYDGFWKHYSKGERFHEFYDKIFDLIHGS